MGFGKFVRKMYIYLQIHTKVTFFFVRLVDIFYSQVGPDYILLSHHPTLQPKKPDFIHYLLNLTYRYLISRTLKTVKERAIKLLA